MSGAIPFACDAVAAAPDAHQKLHAVALLTTCLQRMKECLEVESLPMPVMCSLHAIPCLAGMPCVDTLVPVHVWSKVAAACHTDCAGVLLSLWAIDKAEEGLPLA